MHWASLFSVFLAGTFKFIFAPAVGVALNLTYWETYVSSLLGAILSMLLFYFSAEYFSKRKRKKISEESNRSNHKKIFTRRNRWLIRLKNKIGIVAFAFWVPYFLSIPIGTIIVAKFYGKRKITLPLMIIGQIINNSINVGIVYLLKYEASVIL